MLNSFLLINYDETGVILLGLQAVISKLSDHVLTLHGFSVTSCAEEKEDLGVIINNSTLV